MFLATFLIFLSTCQAAVYDETIGDMLSQCNLYQHDVVIVNRTRHLCEKPDVDDDFSYFITPMETRYAKRKFWCFSFFKDEYFKLKFMMWFSHANYTVNAVSCEYFRRLFA